MSLASEKRTLDPEQVHQLWLALINLLKQLSSKSSEIDSSPSVSIDELCTLLKGDKTESSSNPKKSIDSIDSIVQQAIKEGLIVFSKPIQLEGALTNGTDKVELVTLPLDSSKSVALKTSTNGILKHDWYCFGCHLGGKSLIECQHCWRVYHSACVQSAHDFAVKLEPESHSSTSEPNLVIRARNFTCPVCTLSEKFGQ